MESIMPGAVVPISLVSCPGVTVNKLRLDLGCGGNKRVGFTGIDSIKFPGVDIVCDLVEPRYDELPEGFSEDAPLLRWILKSCERRVIGYKSWPWADCSVAEAHSSHFVEHLTPKERIHFVNELYRVLVPGGKCQIIVPHWASCRAYGDPSHQWPPVSEFTMYYLKREWRLGNPAKGLGANAPHTDAAHRPDGFKCDFDAVWGYSMHPTLTLKHQDVQQHAFAWHKEAIQDLIATLTKV